MRSRNSILCVMCFGIAISSLSSWAQHNRRTTLSLNGTWDVEDSVNADEAPQVYNHTAPVPGLAHSAVPAFPDVDQYQTRQLLLNLVDQGRLSKSDYDKLGDARGVSH